ncbi:MAG: HAD-IIA family hydrolase [Clostridia bacterium]|nr:HAD-IIA family hydrolase [Clostridia bacterium]
MKNIKCVMLDLDGTVYLGDNIFPWTLEFLSRLDSLGIKHIFLTNNSSKGTDAYIQKFAKMGIEADESNILISSHAAADYINNNYKGKRTFILGTESMQNEMKALGVNVCEDEPEILLAGFDTALDYNRLTKFANLVATGLPYIATHPDAVCPAENGFLPDLGSVIELIYACCKRRPQVICGKPNEQILIAAEHKTGFSRENLLMVGDRLTTDIAIGAWGIKTALVLSGEATMEDVPSAPHRPDYIFPSIKELGEALEEANK